VRIATMSDEAVFDALSDTVYQERRRLHQLSGRLSEEDAHQMRVIERAARAIHRDRAAMERAIDALVKGYAYEIHNRFSSRAYRLATRLVPGALTRILTAPNPGDLFGVDLDPTSRVVVHGPVDTLVDLAQTHTLVLAPTHVSNLDSPFIGYALHLAGLPPFIYGAGLNLFSNPAMAFFMSRLGAYTVDRRKKNVLYKQALKDYSVDSLSRRCHSLFFPGGTRSRSGQIEKKLKKGLLGTAIEAWQEGLESNAPNPEILVVPCTLSSSLVLEAETLIEDSLSEEGKSRHIITDDEFSEPRTVASFARKVLNLDSAMHVCFGNPLDVMGNPVDVEGRSWRHKKGQWLDRRAYVTNRMGEVVRDPQRDRVYTEHLASELVKAYHRDNVVLSTHIVSFAAWHLLRSLHPKLDSFHVVLVEEEGRKVSRSDLLVHIEHLLGAVQKRGLTMVVPSPKGKMARAEMLLNAAIERFSHYHSRCAIARVKGGKMLALDPRLILYYGNRLVGYGFEDDMPVVGENR